MYTLAELQREVAAKIERLRDQGRREMHPDWIANAVMADHPDVQGGDRDFYLTCSRITVRNEVRQRMNKTTAKASAGQLQLPGFVHLQDYYIVTRRDQQVSVLVHDLSDEEIETKAREYEAMANSCIEHADELRRFARERQSGEIKVQR